MIWLVLGSSPLAVEARQKAMSDNDVQRIITTNKGIFLEPRPDFYFLSDKTACTNPEIRAALREACKNGTATITLMRDCREMAARDVLGFDEILQEAPPYEPFQLSGLFCLEYAARNGATTILMAGMDGWNKDPNTMDYFRPEWGKRTHVTDWCKTIIKPRCDLLVEKYPHIKWIQYGRPEYKVESPRWTVVAV